VLEKVLDIGAHFHARMPRQALEVDAWAGDGRQRPLVAGDTELHTYQTISRHRQIGEVLGRHKLGVLTLKIGF
jgi:hypothetical protein